MVLSAIFILYINYSTNITLFLYLNFISLYFNDSEKQKDNLTLCGWVFYERFLKTLCWFALYVSISNFLLLSNKCIFIMYFPQKTKEFIFSEKPSVIPISVPQNFFKNTCLCLNNLSLAVCLSLIRGHTKRLCFLAVLPVVGGCLLNVRNTWVGGWMDAWMDARINGGLREGCISERVVHRWVDGTVSINHSTWKVHNEPPAAGKFLERQLEMQRMRWIATASTLQKEFETTLKHRGLFHLQHSEERLQSWRASRTKKQTWVDLNSL